MSPTFELAERGMLPDGLVRWGIRRLLADRLQQLDGSDRQAWLQRMRSEPIALNTADANDQHYEVPAAFFETVLGPHLKYSSGLWELGTTTLAEAEAAMLRLTTERAELADGQRILELGCGWGSLSLWMADHFPNSRITAISNSNSQRRFIEERAASRGLGNLEVRTVDMNDLEAGGPFDRVVSVEMFEHMRNWEQLLTRVADWLAPGGKLFMHVFSHREHSYPFEPNGPKDWMARHFFTGGMMPSHDLLGELSIPLTQDKSWRVSGMHYSKTASAWLANMDRHQARLLPLFVETYGEGEARRWLERWRIFFLACEQLWGYRGGDEWLVSHHRLVKPLRGAV